MNRFHTIIAIILLAGLSCGKKQESVGEILDEFDSGWSVSSTYKEYPATTRNSNLIRINDDTRMELEGFTVWFNNFISDSRSTVMDYSDWNRLLTSSSLSQEDRLTRISMLGDSGIVYPFESESGNRGFLVMNSKTSRTWAEVWDNQAIRRVRVDFEGKSPTTDEVPSLLSCLAALKWPEQDTSAAQPATRPDSKSGGATNLNLKRSGPPSSKRVAKLRR